jgi:arginyl-tRNA synthetase
LKSVIENLLQRAVHALPSSILPPERAVDIEVTRTRGDEHGDFASNVAMRLASAARRSPRELAELVAGALPSDPAVDKIEIARSGFINFFLTDAAYHGEIAHLLSDTRVPPRAGPPWVVEIRLRNPAAPLHADHGRQAAYGATLANLLEAIGHEVLREGCIEEPRSLANPSRRDIEATLGSELEEFGVAFDSRRVGPKRVGPGQAGRTRSDSAASRGESRRVRISGAPSAGRGRQTGPDGPPDTLEVCPVETVVLTRGVAKAAARPGSSVALRAVCDEVGNDAARFFFVTRGADQPLEFDLDLARRRSNDNPLHRIQYAHARVSSLHRQLADRGLAHDLAHGIASLQRLAQPEERRLVRLLGAFAETVERCALERAPQGLVRHLADLADGFHAYQRTHPLIVDEAAVRDARITLACAVQSVLHKGLALVGAQAPHTM